MARLIAVILLAGAGAGCTLAAGIFRAGFWTGLIVAIVLIFGVSMLLRRR